MNEIEISVIKSDNSILKKKLSDLELENLKLVNSHFSEIGKYKRKLTKLENSYLELSEQFEIKSKELEKRNFEFEILDSYKTKLFLDKRYLKSVLLRLSILFILSIIFFVISHFFS